MRYWVLAWKKLLLAGALPLVMGVALGYQGWADWRGASAFLEHMRQTDARVVRVTGLGDAKAEAVLAYTNPEGVPYERTLIVDEQDAAEMRAIGKVTVIYDVRQPGQVEIGNVVSANTEWKLAWVILGLGVLVGAMGLWTLLKEVLATVGRYRLFRTGQLIQTEVRDCNLAPGMQKGRFTYAFRGRDGRWYEGRSPEMPEPMLSPWPAGTPLVVAFDPKNPRLRNEPDIFGAVNAKRLEREQAA